MNDYLDRLVETTDKMIINLIATPRNVSTAIMYSFSRHSQIKVIDEPFYAYYLAKTQAIHPGLDVILKELPTDLHDVFDLIHKKESEKTKVFVKNMAHHLIDVSSDQLSTFVNVFLTRDPRELIQSFSKVIKNPTMNDIGVQAQWVRFEEMKSLGYDPIVIDSGILLSNPKLFLTSLCKRIGLTFEDSMLTWPKGPKREDGSWAKYWYSNVHNSTGFSPRLSELIELEPHQNDLYLEALPYYKLLSQYTLKI